MSYELGLATLRLQNTPRLAHTEYCSNYALVRAVTGRDPLTDGGAWHDFYRAWEFDFIWSVHDGPVGWGERGRVTDMGHAEFLEGGIDRRDTVHCPFRDVDEVLAFDAVEEYGLPDFDELVTFYQRHYDQGQRRHPEQVFPGGYYKTIVSGAIQTFGWEMLLLAAAQRQRFARVLDSFFELSLHHYRAWAKTSIEVFNCHDDMVWTAGPFMHPDIYREVIFPRYAKLWAPLKEAGKTVVYTADGTYHRFIDELVAAGADGFIFEPMTSLETIAAKYGRTHALVSSKVDCRTLTFGTKDQIKAEVDATLRLAHDCAGFMVAVGNHIPSNVPVDNARYYFEYLSAGWDR